MIFSAATRNQIVNWIYNQNWVQQYLKNTIYNLRIPDHYLQDITHDVFVILCDPSIIQIDKMIELLQKNQFKFYLIGVIHRQLTSNRTTNKLFHQYTHYNQNRQKMSNEHYEYWINIYDDPDAVDDELMLQLCDDAYNSLDWYSKKIWELYHQSGVTYMSLAKQTKISHNSLHNTIKQAKMEMKKRINKKLNDNNYN